MRIVLDLQGAQSESRFRGIGRYSLALADAMIREGGQHEILLALSGRFPDSIEQLRTRFANLVPPERIRVFELPGPLAEKHFDNAWRMQAAELLREKFLADLNPDIVHLSTSLEGWGNEVVASVGRLNSAVPAAATLYDLIPLLHPESYLFNPEAKRSYLRHAQSLKRTDVLLAISESSRREAIDALRISPERIVTIGAGIDQRFKGGEPSRDSQAMVKERYGLIRPFVLYTSAIESRKNVEGMIAAFALLRREQRSAHQLAIVGKLQKGDYDRLASLARSHGVDAGDMVCLDHVPDEDLRLLYSNCSVFVFPSLHEGFGLPILEAMICGAPVIGSNCTSIPEIIDRSDALFDPKRPEEIADRMAAVLSNSELRQSLKAWGSQRAKAFTWEACARKALKAFETLHERRDATTTLTVSRGPEHRPLLAFVSPLPPERTEIADYSVNLLPSLARHYDIVCIVDQSEVTDGWISAEFPVRNLLWFEENACRFGRVLYQLGNSLSCKHMFEMIERYPGVVALHDFYLGEALNWMAHAGCISGGFTKALYNSHGFSALEEDRLNGREASIGAFPCNANVLEASIGVITLSEDVTELARKWYGKRAFPPIRPLPSLAHPTEHGSLDHPEMIAARYSDIIEELYRTSPRAAEQELVRAIARTQAPVQPSDADFAKVAVALAANRERVGLSQMLIDVTILARYDAHTGIQRVTRAILTALIADPPPGYRIEPVRAVAGEYFYARQFTSKFLGLSENDLRDDPVEAGRGDIFLGLDWAAEFVPTMKSWFLVQRRHGTRIIFVAYDVLPLLRPEFFPETIPPVALDWINAVAEIADGLVCISRTVADELHEWLTSARPERLEPLSLGFFHLGADLHASVPTRGLPQGAPETLEKLRCRPSFLMVATLEPRKGHRQVLAAMEQLWADGVDANLVIVGKQGWNTDDLAKRIREHPEHEKRLFWLSGISDDMLEQVYRSTRALLASSEGEGFGLPLIEAAQHGVPIIARDIPVFREVAGENAYFFSGEDPQMLASALQTWLSLGDAVPASTGITPLTWHQSSKQLLRVVLKGRWYRSWPHAAANLRTVPLADRAGLDASASSAKEVVVDHRTQRVVHAIVLFEDMRCIMQTCKYGTSFA